MLKRYKSMLTNKRAFTIIELLVVIAILGVLVLLASPRLIGRTNEAQIARIGNDVKVAEVVAQEHRLRKGDFKEWQTTEGFVSSSELNSKAANGLLYNKEGMVGESLAAGDYLVLSDEMVDKEVRSKLKGTFYLSDSGGIYYEHDKVLGEVNYKESSEEDFVLATDEDFVKVAMGPSPASLSSTGSFEPDTAGDWWKMLGYETRDEYFENEYPDINGKYLEDYYYVYIGEENRVEIPDTIQGDSITSYKKMFTNFFIKVNAVKSTNKNVVDISQMFSYKDIQGDLDLSKIDTSNVVNAWGVLEQARADNITISGWDVGNMRSFKIMPRVKVLGEIKIKNLSNMANLKDYSNIFKSVSAKKVDISDWNNNSVNDMSSMFRQARIESLLIPNNFGENVTNMKEMFYEAEIDNMNWENMVTDNVTNMSLMFFLSEIKNIDLSSFDTSKVTNMQSMFNGSKIDKLDLSSFNTSNSKDISLFGNTSAYEILIPNFSLDSVENSRGISGMFAGTKNLKEIDVSNLDFTLVDMGPFKYKHKMFMDSVIEKIYVMNQANKEFLENGSYMPTGVTIEIK